MPDRYAITRDDILEPAAFEAVRAERRQALIARKQQRRLGVGPVATFYFENWDTMWWQIQEMLRIEKGGEAQIADELEAYAPLVPNGHELVATLMFEIPDPVRRDEILRGLGYVEDTVAIELDGERIVAVPELQDSVERTSPDGKTSSVHFLHFPFMPAQIARFRDPAVRAVLSIGHDNYAHMAVLPAAMREELAADFD